LSRRILLVDCDQFFVQCARLADPEGVGREALLLVGGRAEGRGVVTSASYATRAFGVRSGMPTAHALRLCPEARVVPVPRALCGQKSRAVREVLTRFTPQLEPASIDEAYLDLTGTERLYRQEPLAETARRIQAEVLRDAGIQVSIGGGTNRLVAKLAVSRAKPAGVQVVAPGEERGFLADHTLSDLPGVGPVFAAELRRLGWIRVSDALKVDAATLRGLLGARRGDWLHARIRGLDDSPVQPDESARSRSRDETFAQDIDDDPTLHRELRRLSRRLGLDLRTDQVGARTVTVRVRDSDFRTRQASRTLDASIETDGALYAIARALLDRLRAERAIPVRLLGVGASNLVEMNGNGESAGPDQLALFSDPVEAPPLERARDRQLSRITDALRARFGGAVIRTGDLIDSGS
jgi:DNA polymerase IV